MSNYDEITPAPIAAYAEAMTATVAPLYDELRRETYADTQWPQMQVGRIEGRLLKLLVRMSGARSAVEIGTFTGYSALSIAEGLPEDGRLVTCDVNEESVAIARRYFARAPWGGRIEPRIGPALETLAKLEGPFDFAFVDADKPAYIAYWEALVPKMRAGGLIVADNVLWSGRALDPKEESDRGIAAFNEHVAADDRMEQVMLPVRDGITLALKR